MTSSATGGYILPTHTNTPPKHLNLIQFIQTVIVGVSGLEGTLVRPRWQIAPPKQPDISTNWIAMGIREENPDTNAFIGTDHTGATELQRQESIDLGCSFYGPDAAGIIGLVRDGLQIPQNQEALRTANMAFVETTRSLHIPELINERWFDRWEMSVIFRRQVQRSYPILSIVSAEGTIHTVLGDEEYLLAWQTQN